MMACWGGRGDEGARGGPWQRVPWEFRTQPSARLLSSFAPAPSSSNRRAPGLFLLSLHQRLRGRKMKKCIWVPARAGQAWLQGAWRTPAPSLQMPLSSSCFLGENVQEGVI